MPKQWPSFARAAVGLEVRFRRYLAGEHHPQQAEVDRVAFLASASESLIGFVAGHKTKRFGCSGELQWLLVSPEHRDGRVADKLLHYLVDWFVARGALRVCVNVEPENIRARRFYARHGATSLSEHWMIWDDVRRQLDLT